jgi:membrane-bound lytic murein transglycosylase D
MGSLITKRCIILFTGILLIALAWIPSSSAASDQKMIEDITKLLLGEISKLSSRITYLEQQNKTLSRTLSNLLEEQNRGDRVLPEQLQEHLAKKYTLPKVVSFCNERVPIEKWDVWERLDSEFFSFIVDEKQVILWLKRGGKYFPFVEEELSKAGLPDDLKFIAIVESGLRASATSNAGAVGFWQFIESTGNEYELEQNAWLDNRRDLYASTLAAIKYLKKLYGIFHDWPLALAAYNWGESRVLEAMKTQDVHNYYQLELPRETERYVFKIIAAKIILSDPKKYGFYFDEDNLFPPQKVERVEIRLKQSTPLREIAKMYGSYYREIRLLNPEIRTTYLPAGTHTIKVPQGWQNAVTTPQKQPPILLTENNPGTPAEDGSIVYVVKAGDSLSKIANKFKVSISDITKIEGKNKSLSEIHPGEKLLIYKK